MAKSVIGNRFFTINVCQLMAKDKSLDTLSPRTLALRAVTSHD